MTEIILHEKHWPITPDTRDMDIARERVDELNKDPDPRVGDWVIMPDGTYERFAHRWPEGLQTTEGGSFYLGTGYVSMSGGLNPSIPNERIRITDEVKPARYWFFHHDYRGADRGVDVVFPARVYRVIP